MPTGYKMSRREETFYGKESAKRKKAGCVEPNYLRTDRKNVRPALKKSWRSLFPYQTFAVLMVEIADAFVFINRAFAKGFFIVDDEGRVVGEFPGGDA